MKKYNFDVSVLLVREDNRWVAQCLEYDVAAQADTIPEVKNAFERAFACQVAVDVCHGHEPMQNVPKAPKFYHEWFEKAEVLSDRPSYRQHMGKGLEIQTHMKEMRIAA
jgi:hypothetical protein